MAFVFFLLANALLYIRPGEFAPDLVDYPIFEIVIILALALAFPQFLEQLLPHRLLTRPVNLCVVGVWAAVVISHVAHGRVDEAFGSGFEFAKAVTYFLLITALLTSPGRVRQFILWTAAFALVPTCIALIQYHFNVTIIPKQVQKDAYGVERVTDVVLETNVEVEKGKSDRIVYSRLQTTGLFKDPNDYAILLAGVMLGCIYGICEPRLKALRWLWVLPLLTFGYAFALTQSRGGLLSFLAGMLALFHARYGTRKTLWLTPVLLAGVAVVFAGRMTTMSTSETTGQTRIDMWAQGLRMLRESPLFGVGEGKFVMEARQVAHNSFVHCFGELGFAGGMFFLGAFYCGIWGLYRLGQMRPPLADPELRHMRPFLLALLVANAAGLLTLSRAYLMPTYTMLGAASAFLTLASVRAGAWVPRFDFALVKRMALVSVGFLAALYVFIRVFARFG